MKELKISVLLISGIILLGGCAGSKDLSIPEKRIERGGKKTDMMEEGIAHDYDRKAGVHRFMGHARDIAELDVGQDVAEAEAMSSLVQELY